MAKSTDYIQRKLFSVTLCSNMRNRDGVAFKQKREANCQDYPNNWDILRKALKRW